MLRFRQSIAVLALASATVVLACSQEPMQLGACDIPELPSGSTCGIYEVWEDREARSGRRIPLHVALVPALNPTPTADPILVLQGGPGVSNISGFERLSRSPLLGDHPLLLIDLRGTGRSNPLDCDMTDPGANGLRTDFMPMDRIRACRASLDSVADLTRYTTLDAIDDVADVLEALGIRRVNIWGFSGGTRQAQAFIRRHAALARSALLEGPVPMDARTPMTAGPDAQLAWDGVVADCREEAACARSFPRLREEFLAVMRRLDSAPPTVEFVDTATQSTGSFRVTGSAFAQVVRYMLYSPGATRELPLAVHLAARGDFTPLIGRLRTLGVPGAVTMGFYLSSTCAEDVPFFAESAAAAASATTFLGPYRIRQQKAACEGWPRRQLPASWLEPVRSEVPVLVLAGERDPVTPPHWGDAIVRHFANGRSLVVPGGGHSFAGLEGVECLDELRTRFLRDASPSTLDASCLGGVRRPPFILEGRNR